MYRIKYVCRGRTIAGDNKPDIWRARELAWTHRSPITVVGCERNHPYAVVAICSPHPRYYGAGCTTVEWHNWKTPYVS